LNPKVKRAFSNINVEIMDVERFITRILPFIIIVKNLMEASSQQTLLKMVIDFKDQQKIEADPE
jgi:hypothetical protein